MHTEEHSQGKASVTFTIDGLEYTSNDRRQTAAELLALAGLDPADHDLVRVVGRGEVEKRLADEVEVQLTPGVRFISIFTGATPVA